MGTCTSMDLLGLNIYELRPDLMPWRHVFEALKLTNYYLLQMHQVFRKIDVNNSGTIEIIELLNFLDIERTRFTKRVFSIFDDDGSGSVDFREFVLSLWNYCTLGKSTLVLFAFDLYDTDNDGCIDHLEFEELLKDVYGKTFNANKQAQRIVEEIADIKTFDVEILTKFAEKHPTLFYPIYYMQQKLRKKVLGRLFWLSYTKRRLLLFNEQYKSMRGLMDLHVNKTAMDLIMEQEPKYPISSLEKLRKSNRQLLRALKHSPTNRARTTMSLTKQTAEVWKSKVTGGNNDALMDPLGPMVPSDNFGVHNHVQIIVKPDTILIDRKNDIYNINGTATPIQYGYQNTTTHNIESTYGTSTSITTPMSHRSNTSTVTPTSTPTSHPQGHKESITLSHAVIASTPHAQPPHANKRPGGTSPHKAVKRSSKVKGKSNPRQQMQQQQPVELSTTGYIKPDIFVKIQHPSTIYSSNHMSVSEYTIHNITPLSHQNSSSFLSPKLKKKPTVGE